MTNPFQDFLQFWRQFPEWQRKDLFENAARALQRAANPPAQYIRPVPSFHEIETLLRRQAESLNRIAVAIEPVAALCQMAVIEDYEARRLGGQGSGEPPPGEGPLASGEHAPSGSRPGRPAPAQAPTSNGYEDDFHGR